MIPGFKSLTKRPVSLKNFIKINQFQLLVLHRSNKNSEFEESNTSKKLQSIIQEVNRKDNQESDGDEVSTGSSKILPPEDYYLSTDDEPIPPPSADNEERTRPNTSILPSSAAVERFRRGTPTAPVDNRERFEKIARRC
uniref:Uncharacterized protein n=1 Tax=Rhizophagus irregularis (strain DAOM 181602 / DAOM 197198 / MUCL 43194) TaxID=747089 RepID=U9SSK1_RHIID